MKSGIRFKVSWDELLVFRFPVIVMTVFKVKKSFYEFASGRVQ